MAPGASSPVPTPPLRSRGQQLYATAVYATAHLCIGLTVGIKGPALLKLAAQSQGMDASMLPANATDAGLAAVGASNAAASFGLMVGALTGGILIDRVPKWHRLFAANWLCCAVFFAGFAMSRTVAGLVAVSALHGVTIGVFQPCFNVGTLRTWEVERVGPYMQFVHSTFGLGMFLVPLAVGAELRATGGFHATVWVIGAVICVLAVLPLFAQSPQDVQPAKAVASTQTTAHQSSQSDRQWRERVTLGACFSFSFMASLMELSIGTWIPAYATVLDLMTETDAASLGSAFWGSFTVGRLSGIPLSQCFSNVQMIWLDLLLLSLSMGTIVWMDGTASLEVLVVCVCCYAFAIGTLMASLFGLLADARVHLTAQRSSGFPVFGLCGDMCGQAAMSFVFIELGPAAMMEIALGVIGMCILLFAAIVYAVLPWLAQASPRSPALSAEAMTAEKLNDSEGRLGGNNGQRP